MNKEHPFLSLFMSNNPKLISLGHKLIMDTSITSARLGLLGNSNKTENEETKYKTFTFRNDSTSIDESCHYILKYSFGDDSPEVYTKKNYVIHSFKRHKSYTIKCKVINTINNKIIDTYEQLLEVD